MGIEDQVTAYYVVMGSREDNGGQVTKVYPLTVHTVRQQKGNLYHPPQYDCILAQRYKTQSVTIAN